jgi:hypothetical protein
MGGHTLVGRLSGIWTQSGIVTASKCATVQALWWGRCACGGMPRLCIKLYPRIRLTTEENHGKTSIMAGYLVAQYLYLTWALAQSRARANPVIDDVIQSHNTIQQTNKANTNNWTGSRSAQCQEAIQSHHQSPDWLKLRSAPGTESDTNSGPQDTRPPVTTYHSEDEDRVGPWNIGTFWCTDMAARLRRFYWHQ